MIRPLEYDLYHLKTILFTQTKYNVTVDGKEIAWTINCLLAFI